MGWGAEEKVNVQQFEMRLSQNLNREESVKSGTSSRHSLSQHRDKQFADQISASLNHHVDYDYDSLTHTGVRTSWITDHARSALSNLRKIFQEHVC